MSLRGLKKNGVALAVENVGSATPVEPIPNPEVVADAKRRTFTLEYKMRILAEAEAAKDHSGGVGALLRREGLYSSHLTTWRKEREAGVRRALAPKTRGPKSKRDPQQEELRQLRRDKEQLTEALRKAELIIEVQKKSARSWGGPCRTPTRKRSPDGYRALVGLLSRRSGCLSEFGSEPCDSISPASAAGAPSTPRADSASFTRLPNSRAGTHCTRARPCSGCAS